MKEKVYVVMVRVKSYHCSPSVSVWRIFSEKSAAERELLILGPLFSNREGRLYEYWIDEFRLFNGKEI